MPTLLRNTLLGLSAPLLLGGHSTHHRVHNPPIRVFNHSLLAGVQRDMRVLHPVLNFPETYKTAAPSV